jgi:hypothetical protein
VKTGHKVSISGLRKLPRLIEDAEAQGQPVIISWPLVSLGPMPEHTQKLYATLGVSIRFV